MRTRRGARTTALSGSGLLAAAVAVLLAAAPAGAQLPIGTPAPRGPSYSNPVLAGDYPDPSVIRVGKEYFAVVTSGDWHPPFTVFRSSDLVNWQPAGSVLRRHPSWAHRDFWAPELQHIGSRFLVYYSARRAGGRHCLAVASAPKPVGFFHDHGPIVCTPFGSIDPLPARDERGRPYLLWKEGGNPTRIVAGALSDDGLRLAGAPRELLRNDAPWEGRVVEAPTLTRHGDHLYLLYSARRCCGPGCDYVTGVARATKLLGRWEKHPGPILSGNRRFQCPGHGSVAVVPGGRRFFIYHAYAAGGRAHVGRQLLVDRLEWTLAGWPTVNEGRGPSTHGVSPMGAPQHLRRPAVIDEFRGPWLAPGWQWPSDRPRMRIDGRAGGRLVLGPLRRGVAGVVGRQPGAVSYTAETVVRRRRRGRAGIAVYMGPGRALGIELRRKRVVAWRSAPGGQRVLGRARAGRRVGLRLRAKDGQAFGFELATRRGWRQVGPAGYTPPWWIGVSRVVLRTAGPARGRGLFERFAIRPEE